MEVIIFDIDGTLADLRHRLHFIKQKNRDYESFYSDENILKDPLIKPVARIYDSFISGGTVVIGVSGRPERTRKATIEWLSGVHGIFFRQLYMRKDDDFRPDYIIKEEILQQIKADGYEPTVAIDDRQSIVDMWRRNGIICLQCAPDEQEIPTTGKIILMVGPSGAGKSTWLLKSLMEDSKYHVLSSDQIRSDMCNGDFKDQSKNDQVFDYIHDVVKLRAKYGLSTIIDATNIRNRDRLAIAKLVPDYIKIHYYVFNRNMNDKIRDAGWRPTWLLEKHEQTFNSNLKDILAGDGLPNVTVHDFRTTSSS